MLSSSAFHSTSAWSKLCPEIGTRAYISISKMPPKLVKATIEDMPEVARLFRISRESELPYLPKLHTPEEDLEFFRSVVFPNQKVHVLWCDQKLVGFIAFDPEWIHHLYVLPDAIGKGFGKLLLQIAMSEGKPLKLWAFKRNERAIKFYEKQGFRIIEETDGGGNQEKEPDVLMEFADS